MAARAKAGYLEKITAIGDYWFDLPVISEVPDLIVVDGAPRS